MAEPTFRVTEMRRWFYVRKAVTPRAFVTDICRKNRQSIGRKIAIQKLLRARMRLLRTDSQVCPDGVEFSHARGVRQKLRPISVHFQWKPIQKFDRLPRESLEERGITDESRQKPPRFQMGEFDGEKSIWTVDDLY